MNSIKAVAAKSEGDEKVREGNYQEAVPFYQEAVRIDPSYLQAWNNLGYCYAKMGRTEEANQVRDKLKELKGGAVVPDKSLPARSLRQEDGKHPLSGSGLFFATAWSRWFAFILDTLIVVLIFSVPFALLILMYPDSPELFLILVPAFFVGYWLYFAIFEAGAHRSTPGKRALSLYVLDDNGHRLSFPVSLERSFFKVLFTLSPFSLLTLVNGFVIGSSAQSKGLHDYVANTIVVTRKRTEKPVFASGGEENLSLVFLLLIIAIVVIIGVVILGAMVASFLF
jgi:uncharacterized RDD family membrane protein YckC